jgi:ABC-type methionine transport system permease subunit
MDWKRVLIAIHKPDQILTAEAKQIGAKPVIKWIIKSIIIAINNWSFLFLLDKTMPVPKLLMRNVIGAWILGSNWPIIRIEMMKRKKTLNRITRLEIYFTRSMPYSGVMIPDFLTIFKHNDCEFLNK